MPASSLQELWNIEGNVEKAFKDWFTDKSLELQTSESELTLPDYFIAASFELGAITGHVNTSIGPAGEYDQFECTVNVIVRTRRHGEEDSQTVDIDSRHQELVGYVRTWLSVSQARGSALETYLEYYEIKFLRPSGTAYDQAGDFTETTLIYSGQINILTNAWP